MRVFEWRRHFWGEEDKEEELELECTEEEQKTEKASSQKRERGGGGVGLREEDDDEQQQQQQQPWRGTKKKRTCVSMILSVLMCFSLSVSFFFLSSLPNCVDSYIYFCDCAFI